MVHSVPGVALTMMAPRATSSSNEEIPNARSLETREGKTWTGRINDLPSCQRMATVTSLPWMLLLLLFGLVGELLWAET